MKSEIVDIFACVLSASNLGYDSTRETSPQATYSCSPQQITIVTDTLPPTNSQIPHHLNSMRDCAIDALCAAVEHVPVRSPCPVPSSF